jgi:hypothetical protein
VTLSRSSCRLRRTSGTGFTRGLPVVRRRSFIASAQRSWLGRPQAASWTSIQGSLAGCPSGPLTRRQRPERATGSTRGVLPRGCVAGIGVKAASADGYAGQGRLPPRHRITIPVAVRQFPWFSRWGDFDRGGINPLCAVPPPEATCACFGPNTTRAVRFMGCPDCPSVGDALALCGFPHWSILPIAQGARPADTRSNPRASL